MLFSLLKVLIFVGVVGALAILAVLLLEMPGGIQIQFQGVEISLSVLQAIIAALVFIVVVLIALKLIGLLIATLRFINGDETAISRYFTRNRERRGFDALSEGMMALASGEGRLAMSKAAKAERYLNKPELTNLLTAQAAEMTGDRKKAEEVYKRLLKDDRTRFVGVRGLLKQKLDDGDTDTALKLAEKAFALKPKHVETQDALLKLQAGEQDWSGARKTLGAKLKHGALPRDVHKRRDAVMAISQARDLRREGKIDEAQKLAIEADRLSPELIPAAVMAAKAHIEQDKPRYATRVLKAAWDKQPHPDLAAAFAAIAPDESTDARIKRFKTFTKSKTGHPETKMVMAELYVSAEDFPAARKALGDLPTTDPSMRALTIMAAIERGEGADDQIVRGWLTKALNAPRDPQWICDNCGHVHNAWDPVCDSCGAVDSLSWKRPAGGDVETASSVQMLPLIVGQIEAPNDSTVEDAEVVESTIEAEDEPKVVSGETIDVSVPEGATRH